MMRPSNRNQFIKKPNVTLQNRLNNETITGDLVNEDEIDGKMFFVLHVGRPPRLMKLAKDAYTLKKTTFNR
jgi:hypothetical protein